ncbi:MAG: peptidase M28, partial [Flavobacteriaceae bacterium]|nr:peptidase M28 [Flavobacteriaceae bacterium]
MKFTVLFILAISFTGIAQTDQRLYDIVDAVSSKNIEHDIRKLADFGTRHTFSDTLSNTRGIGAARRWIKAQIDEISK